MYAQRQFRSACASRSLIKIISGCIIDSQGCFSCGQRRLKSDCAYAQADLSFRWIHMLEGTFSRVAVQFCRLHHITAITLILFMCR